MNKLRIYANCLISVYIFTIIYLQYELSYFATFALIAFMLFLIFYIELKISTYSTETVRKTEPSSLYPSLFFDEVFSLCKKEELLIIENVQKNRSISAFSNLHKSKKQYFSYQWINKTNRGKLWKMLEELFDKSYEFERAKDCNGPIKKQDWALSQSYRKGKRSLCIRQWRRCRFIYF